MQHVIAWSQQGRVAGVTSNWVCSSAEYGRRVTGSRYEVEVV